jgi:4-hydroxythreonine-4-phosphate dehydrogenase
LYTKGKKMNNIPVLGIILGDHAGSSPEMVAKAVLHNDGSYIPVLIGNRNRFEISRKAVEGGESFNILPLLGRPGEAVPNAVFFCEVEAGEDIRFSEVSADSGKLIFDSIKTAIDLEKSGVVDGLSMAPITKESLHAAGFDFSTEFEIFQKLYGTTGCRAVIKCGDIFRSTVVGHCAFVDIVRKLNAEGIVTTTEGLHAVMLKFLPHAKCKIAVAALNPHASENGLYGNEENLVITPAIECLKEKGYDVIGPSPADTVFLKALQKQVSGVVFLYHDQGNIAMKSVFFGDGVLIYINIPADIVSVGHGPAFGKAGKGTADPKNIIASIDVLKQLVLQKKAVREPVFV